MNSIKITAITCITTFLIFFSMTSYSQAYDIKENINTSHLEEDVERLPMEKEGYRCYWMENQTGKFRWVPAEQGQLYHGEGLKECYLLDSCNGGKGYSNGGCYKWAFSPNAERVSWGTKQAFIAQFEKKGTFEIVLTDKASCPKKYEWVTFDEAAEISYKVCEKLATSWQIIRLGKNASMDGAAYGCKVRKHDDRKLGHVLCKKKLKSY